MKELLNGNYTGERALFHIKDTCIKEGHFYDGESPLKESSNLIVKRCEFGWKYPMWYGNNIQVESTLFLDTARSGIWYTNHMNLNNCNIMAPKMFRRCEDIIVTNSFLPHAQETFWHCKNIQLNNVHVTGDYFAMNCENVILDNFTIEGNYLLDGGKNIVVKNSKLISKDAFWNCENVVVENSYIIGEYLCWNTKNITFRNCIIESNQGMCYVEDLVLEDCKVLNTELAFEYSTVNAKIVSIINSIKNPIKGNIECFGIKNVIFDENNKGNQRDVKIITSEVQK